MSGKAQPQHAQFTLPVVMSQEFAELIDDVKKLMGDLRRQIEVYKQHSEKNIFSEKEAADFFGISVKSMREERNAGKITYKAVKGQFFYTRQNLEDYVDTDQVTAKKKPRRR